MRQDVQETLSALSRSSVSSEKLRQVTLDDIYKKRKNAETTTGNKKFKCEDQNEPFAVEAGSLVEKPSVVEAESSVCNDGNESKEKAKLSIKDYVMKYDPTQYYLLTQDELLGYMFKYHAEIKIDDKTIMSRREQALYQSVIDCFL